MRLSLNAAVLSVIAVAIAVPLTAAEHQVTVKNFVFEPANLIIEVGDTVTWTNEGGLHNVESDSFRCAEGCDGMGGDGSPSSSAWSFSLTFDEPDTIDYVCIVHEGLGMVGTLTVVEVGGVSLTLSGTCPGPMTIAVDGATANGTVVLLTGTGPGSDPIPVGSCAGLETGLSSLSPVTPLQMDAQGSGQINPTIPAPGCGRMLQVLDLGSCSMSNVATLGN